VITWFKNLDAQLESTWLQHLILKCDFLVFTKFAFSNGFNLYRYAAALKGVVRPDDAMRAVEAGFDAIWVSNHGGRQLETAPAPIDVLPSIREALVGLAVQVESSCDP
jgi:hypothetical protein